MIVILNQRQNSSVIFSFYVDTDSFSPIASITPPAFQFLTDLMLIDLLRFFLALLYYSVKNSHELDTHIGCLTQIKRIIIQSVRL